MNKTIRNSVCLGCTCVCDDLEVEWKGGVPGFLNPCTVGEDWLATRPPQESCWIGGKSSSFSDGISEAKRLLENSRSPLITRLDGLTTEAQQAAVRLARKRNATIDSTLSRSGRSATMALQRRGMSTATLGEINQRGDTIVFWFCDPMSTHPRLIERYCNAATKMVVVDEKKSATSERADLFLQATPFEALSGLSRIRLGVKEGVTQPTIDGLSNAADSLVDSHDQPAFLELGRLLARSKYAVSFFGETTSESACDPLTDSITALSQELTSVTRAVSIALRSDRNAIGAENVICWNTGAPFGVQFPLDRDSFSMRNWSARYLAGGHCDLAVVTSFSETVDGSILRLLADVDTIWIVDNLNGERVANECGANVVLSAGRPGVSDGGSWCRLDDVALAAGALAAGPYPSAESILARMG